MSDTAFALAIPVIVITSLMFQVGMWLIVITVKSMGAQRKEREKAKSLVDAKYIHCLEITGSIEPETASTFIRALRKIPSDHGVVVLIDSLGGEISSGDAISTAINAHQGPVALLVKRWCGSTAFDILLSVPVEQRFGVQGSLYMFHRTTSSERKPGTPETVASDARLAALNAGGSVDSTFLEKILEQTTLPSNLVRAVFEAGGDYYLSSKLAVEYGVITAIV